MRKVKELPVDGRVGNKGLVKYLKEAEKLRTDPNQWYELKKCTTGNSAGSMASQIRAGKYAAFPVGAFEAVSREATVFIRYVG